MDAEEAIALCDEILELLPQLPERAEDFRASVEEKVTGIRATVEEREDVTEAQATALGNMRAGVERWLER